MQQRQVVDFHRAMAIPVAEQPTMLTRERAALRLSFMEEEVHEFGVAAESGAWLAMVDALVDLLYFTLGTAVEMGVELEPFFEEVHQANLRKLPSEPGVKSIKPPDWQPPDLLAVYRRVYGSLPLPVAVDRVAADESG